MARERKIAPFGCGKFNCNRSKYKWQCCHYCENVKRCERGCKNGVLTCGYLTIKEEE